MSNPERYRRYAEEMRIFALRASTPDVSNAYRELARQWDALALHADDLAIKADPWPELEDRRRGH